ncbi:MAG TPA: metalloregulator ArsR/SmtB family transcription factor [Spirochaetota bacterium]|nr:metalloregulator ArsR/SmtB family transcription factor [Spirochaetota bacterium]HQO00970.1 metalloregulator ArsR/SmtB family transcription factor [Spirochaetota bacterium]HQP49405.1 metalloregulator ArsR/SmtB family transcription factor [Spirochaetota bacterium]HQP50103.1 metalloregulator ArsR/SmtB family transcription factor [Spirochaetota bacterium]
MSYAKRNEFEERFEKMAEFAKCLSHPARIAILKTLAERNTCICGEIVDILPLAQSTVSQHLKELKKCGLIIGEIDGPRSCYCINVERLREMEKLFREIISSLDSDMSACSCT